MQCSWDICVVKNHQESNSFLAISKKLRLKKFSDTVGLFWFQWIIKIGLLTPISLIFFIFKFLSFRGGKDSMLSIKIWGKAKILKHLPCKTVPISGFYRLKSAEVNVFGYLVIYRCTSCTIMLSPVSVCFQIVCQACSSNKHGLDYMKNQPARVCDHCFRELQKQGK